MNDKPNNPRYLAIGIFLSVAGEALDFLLLALVTALASQL